MAHLEAGTDEGNECLNHDEAKVETGGQHGTEEEAAVAAGIFQRDGDVVTESVGEDEEVHGSS